MSRHAPSVRDGLPQLSFRLPNLRIFQEVKTTDLELRIGMPYPARSPSSFSSICLHSASEKSGMEISLSGNCGSDCAPTSSRVVDVASNPDDTTCCFGQHVGKHFAIVGVPVEHDSFLDAGWRKKEVAKRWQNGPYEGRINALRPQ